MLKKIRVGVSLLFFVLITLFFLDFAGWLPIQFHLLTKIQFIPALLALNIGVLIFIVLLTLVFGRIYCSSICPMGVYQDIVAWFSKQFNKKKKYTFSKAKTVLRWATLALTVIAFLFGFTFLLGFLDPYGAFGRITTHIFRPAYLLGNNLLEKIFTSFDNQTFYQVSIYSLGLFSTLIALFTFLGIGFLAWRNGRTYCNTLCPVGTVLGFLNKFSLLKLQFGEGCGKCGKCSKACKTSCIDVKNQKIDYSRCVNCFNCMGVCDFSEMKYRFAYNKPKTQVEPKEVDESKRRFISALAITSIAATKIMAEKVPLIRKHPIKKQLPIAPPGAKSVEKFQDKCISCHLCVSKCPSQVLKPSFTEYGLGGMMQPMVYFDKGFCNYDCTLCSDVCPTDALTKLTKEEKHHNQMGVVYFVRDNCIVFNDETQCGACSEHCPTQAVFMVSYKGDLTIPNTNTAICVGCGGCEYVCPAKPHKAIYVEGLKVHNTIKLQQEKKENVKVDDFGF